MCGLCGVALRDPRKRPEQDQLSAMARTLVHRGPDDEGFAILGSAGLAFRRLSIIDVAGGHQPLFNEEGNVALLFNGELFNYRPLRDELVARGHVFKTQTDSEVLVHLYEEEGEHLARRLTGMFAFAIADVREPGPPRIVLGRDALGIKPMYYAETADALLFASEPKAILAWGGLSRRLRAKKLLDYLVQGYVGGEESAWEGIRRLPPASVLTWRAGGGAPKVERYWDLPREGLREPAADDEILEWLDRVVADWMMAEVPLGAFLSGGVDSTAVATSMARAARGPIVACSMGFRERSHDELATAVQTAQRLGAQHFTATVEPDPRLAIDVLPWFYDEPLADPSTVPTYLVSRMAREHVTVALSGDGGDETFAGYRRYAHDLAENRVRGRVGARGQTALARAAQVYPRLEWAPRFLRARTFLANVARDPARAYWHSVTQLERADALELLAPPVREMLSDYDPFEAFAEHYRRPAVDDPLYRAQYADFHTYLPDQILAKVDRASMAVSLEARPPILDHRFVERFANLPAQEKVRRGRGKHAFRSALRSRVPADILDGEKRGFDTPLSRWIRGPLAPSVADALASLPSSWFDRSALEGRLAEHLGGRRNHGRLLWSALVLEQWRRRHGVTDLST